MIRAAGRKAFCCKGRETHNIFHKGRGTNSPHNSVSDAFLKGVGREAEIHRGCGT